MEKRIYESPFAKILWVTEKDVITSSPDEETKLFRQMQIYDGDKITWEDIFR